MIETIWPRSEAVRWLDRAAARLRYLPGFCIVCCHPTAFVVDSVNLRESVVCRRCGSFNRQRQLLAVLLKRYGCTGARAGLRDLPRDLSVWNLECKRTLHERLRAHFADRYTSSEYFGPELSSGERRDGVLHVDVENTHFGDASFDLVLSSDVFEHIPNPEKATKEIHRVLRPGGAHVFTVPFYLHRFTSERRAMVNEHGEVVHLLPPVYHSDPLRPDGVLVFNIFAPEYLCHLESVGFEVKIHELHDPLRGLLGDGALVFVAQKRTS